jgi:hypothetical protein
MIGGIAGSALSPTFGQSGDGTGPPVGQKVPEFSATDQNGRPRAFSDLVGPNGLLLLFHRSADW